MMIAKLFPPFSSGRQAVALLLLRLLVVGIAFLFHGYGKAADIAAFADEFQMPYLVAAAAAYVQFGDCS